MSADIESIPEATVTPRDILLERLDEDLLGPSDPEELIPERPSDRYLTGILYPPNTGIAPAENDESGDDSAREDSGSDDSPVSLTTILRPSSAGISFAATTDSGRPTLSIRIRCGTYEPVELEIRERAGLAQEGEEEEGRAGEPCSDGPDDQSAEWSAEVETVELWRRTDHDELVPPMTVAAGDSKKDLTPHGIEKLTLYLRSQQLRDGWAVTVALVNEWETAEGREDTERRSFFQVAIEVEPGAGTRFRALPSPRPSTDEDDRVSQLIYRGAVDFAGGHTCSAEWDTGEDGIVHRIRSAWLPRTVVPAVSPQGDEIFRPLSDAGESRPLSAEWLSEAPVDRLVAGLERLPAAYLAWVDAREGDLAELPKPLVAQARRNLERCRAAAGRMRGAIALIREDEKARTAFQLANRAMRLQRAWSSGKADDDLRWRPFQLGFQLLTLRSLANREDEERDVMDLLWFPTGGGKTEAYLALTAFTLLHRRLVDGGELGAGVAVIMRYTLRVLTVQQFQRAAALILACEFIRRKRLGAGSDALGLTPFSLGLWVGGGATPNTVREAAEGEGEPGKDYRQVRSCPCCGERLRWERKPRDVRVRCVEERCELAASGDNLPIWTIDELVYRHRPSLVIGTVDKFAQVTRNIQTGALFSTDGAHVPPDLIIQDELHLISGPLGTLTALYEIAIDELCSFRGRRPKVIGSTATIRRAADHIKALFDRTAFQFPPPALDASNSCFAVVDEKHPGRLYVGLSSAGRSPKFTLQAASASLLQSATDVRLDDSARDPYWTLVAYFNALRELGGALVLMQDDVTYSIDAYASRRAEPPRTLSPPEELTSRKGSSEIPDMLKALARSYGQEGVYDILLASNMISVGMDIARLGLMLMNGQPKGISEYIQATSRVGRGSIEGLILTVFNSGRVRDRSHFETFPGWHRTLYRDVEATSVTPFASRAQDRGLHGVLVALVRHRIAGMGESPVLNEGRLEECRRIIERIARRAGSVDPGEKAAVEKRLEELLRDWLEHRELQAYWDDFGGKETLLMSAEQHAAKVIGGESEGRVWPTPNSMREVEPSTSFVLRKGLSDGGGARGAQE